MKNSSARWMTMASLLVAGAAANLACSSDNKATDAGGGTGGKLDSGSTGTGGAIVDAGNPDVQVVHLLVNNFDTTTEMWSLNNYADPNSRNLFGAYPTDGAVDAQVFDGGVVTPPTLTFDSTVGSPAPGSLKITATFTDCNQYVDVAINLAPTKNLTGKTLHGRLQVTSGGFSGGAQLHVSTGADYGAYAKADFALTATTPPTFSNAALDLTNAIPSTGVLDPTNVIQVGVQIYSGAACTTALPYANAGETVVFNIDTITD
jgi:hypothetical protein